MPEPRTLWGLPVVISDVVPSDTIGFVVGDLGPALDEHARDMRARAAESHTFAPCGLAGPDGPWCAALCHHGPCFKPEAEHHV